MTWLVNPKSVKEGKWVPQPRLTPEVKEACDTAAMYLKDHGFSFKRYDTELLNMCTFDFFDPKLEKKVVKVLRKVLEKLPEEKKERFKKRLEDYKVWSSRSSISFTESEEKKETVNVLGDLATPIYYYPGFAGALKGEIDLTKLHEPCKVEEIHIHNYAGQPTLHVHVRCVNTDPVDVVFEVGELLTDLSMLAEDFIDESKRLAKGKE